MKKAKGEKPFKAKAKTEGVSSRFEEPDDLLTDSSPLGHRGIPPEDAFGKKENLGDRLRKARELRGLTLMDLSSRTGIRIDTLKKVEMNEMIPPLGDLIKLGKAVEMKMGYFISTGIDKPMVVVRSDSRVEISRYGKKRSEQYGYFYESLAPEKANRFMEPFLITMVPSEVEELSSHDGQEFIFVLEGEIQAQVRDQAEILQPGDAVYYDSSCPHLIKCTGGKSAKILAVLYTGTKE